MVSLPFVIASQWRTGSQGCPPKSERHEPNRDRERPRRIARKQRPLRRSTATIPEQSALKPSLLHVDRRADSSRSFPVPRKSGRLSRQCKKDPHRASPPPRFLTDLKNDRGVGHPSFHEVGDDSRIITPTSSWSREPDPSAPWIQSARPTPVVLFAWIAWLRTSSAFVCRFTPSFVHSSR